MQHVADNVMIGLETYMKKVTRKWKKTWIWNLLMKERESMFQNVRQNIQQDMTSSCRRYLCKHLENAFQIATTQLKQWIYTADKETVEAELAKSKKS